MPSLPLDRPVAPPPELRTETAGPWSIVGGVLITAAMVFGIARAFYGDGLKGLAGAVPTDPWFYITSIILYATLPLSDYIIFRRLWQIPPAGLIALVKKTIANDVVLGYAGEAYFYSWAKARARMVAAPFGAVKDVSILSAIAGNAATLAMAAMAVPFAYRHFAPAFANTLGLSVLAVIATSAPFLIFAKRVFSLPAAQLRWIFGVHMARLIAAMLLLALVWHFGRPDVSIGSLMLLSAGRMLVGRLPLVPNKDLLFANIAILFVGQGHGISALVAVTAAFTLLIHLALIVVFGLASVVRSAR